jgi:hypothetical protein
MRLALDELLRRFFPPNGFVRTRHFGFFAHRRRAALLPLCLALLPAAEPQTAVPTSLADALRPIWTCPRCGGPMAIAERFTAAEARLRAPPPRTDTI